MLGIPTDPYLEQAKPAGLAHFNQNCDRLRKAGYELLSVPVMTNFEEIRARHNLIVAAEAAHTHRLWFERHADRYHPKTAELIRSGLTIKEAELQKALEGRLQLRQELTVQMFEHGIDAWLSPAAPGPAPRGIESTGNPVMNLPWTHSGLPTLTLPSGTDPEGLPLGLQLAAGWYQDEELFLWGLELQHLLPEGGVLR